MRATKFNLTTLKSQSVQMVFIAAMVALLQDAQFECLCSSAMQVLNNYNLLYVNKVFAVVGLSKESVRRLTPVYSTFISLTNYWFVDSINYRSKMRVNYLSKFIAEKRDAKRKRLKEKSLVISELREKVENTL